MSDCPPQTLCIGPFTVGEIPAPLLYQFQDADGDPLPVTGYATPKFVYRERDGSPVTVDGAWEDQPAARVRYTWVAGDFVSPGHFRGEFWIGNGGTNRFASVLITWDVRQSVGPVPGV